MQLLTENAAVAEVAVKRSFRSVREAVGAVSPARLEDIRENEACGATVRADHLREVAQKVEHDKQCESEMEKRVGLEDRRVRNGENVLLVGLVSGDEATSNGRTENDGWKVIHELSDNHNQSNCDNEDVGESFWRVLRQIHKRHLLNSSYD